MNAKELRTAHAALRKDLAKAKTAFSPLLGAVGSRLIPEEPIFHDTLLTTEIRLASQAKLRADEIETINRPSAWSATKQAPSRLKS